MGKVASSGEGRKGLGLSNNNAASEHYTDVRQVEAGDLTNGRGAVGRGRSLSFSVREEERR